MQERTCSVEGCDRGGKLTRGMCAKHYRNWLDHTPPEERGPAPRFSRDFWDFVEKIHEHGCWIWHGPFDRQDYGRWGKTLAHRHSWETANGAIPDGLWALHYCDNPPCVNPKHLYLGTVVENTIDAVTRGRNYVPPPKTHCRNNHPLEGDNLRIVGRNKHRVCRTCDNERSRLKQADLRQQGKVPKPKLARPNSPRKGHRLVFVRPGSWCCKCGEKVAARNQKEARKAMDLHRRAVNADREYASE